jgi:hypothetical protein
MKSSKKRNRNSKEVIPLATAIVATATSDTEIFEAKVVEEENEMPSKSAYRTNDPLSQYRIDSRQNHQSQSIPNVCNDVKAKEFLRDHHWPDSMADAMINNFSSIPFRFFVIDDSGSMVKDDGKTIHINSDGSSR